MKDVLLRCRSCGAANRVKTANLKSHPKCGSCKAELDYPDKPVEISSNNFQSEIIKAPGVVLLEFWSPECGHCRRLNPVLDEVASEFAGLLKIARVNVLAEQALASKFGIRGVPALYLYNGGKRAGNLNGAPSDKSQLVNWLRITAGI